MTQSIKLSLAYLSGRASGAPIETGTLSRYLRLPQILAAHYIVAATMRLQGRRFETDLSHRLVFEIGRHRSSGPGWFAGGTFDRSITGYQVGDHMQVEMVRSSEIYSLSLSFQDQKISSVSHDGKNFALWIDSAVPQDLHPEIDRIFLRYINPWLLTTSQNYAVFETKCREVEVAIAGAMKKLTALWLSSLAEI